MIKAIVLFAALFSSIVWAQDMTPVPTDQFIAALFQFMGGMQGMSVLAIVAAVVQLLMLFFRTSLAAFAGKWSLLIVGALSVVGSVVGLMASGMTFLAALLNGATLMAIQVLLYQVYNQFFVKKDEAPKA